jgi:uncharacterized protein YpmB
MDLAFWRNVSIVWLILFALVFTVVPGVIFYFCVRGMNVVLRKTETGLKVAQKYSGLTRQVVVTNSDVVADKVLKARMQATKVTTFVSQRWGHER